MTDAVIVAEPGMQNITMTRDFDATPEQLFLAHTDPELLKQWLGPRGYEMTIDAFEAKDGGRWAYSHIDKGDKYDFRGVFHGEPSVEGITQTFEFLGFPGIVSVETLKFEDLGNGRTRIHNLSVYPSVEARDGMVASGMEQGVNEGYERLDEILASS
ncbi:MAG: SRPBCC family protein [Actinomycetota bacterium]|nr:SRPBCC family protein [Actinomycetota bacterium]